MANFDLVRIPYARIHVRRFTFHLHESSTHLYQMFVISNGLHERSDTILNGTTHPFQSFVSRGGVKPQYRSSRGRTIRVTRNTRGRCRALRSDDML